MIGEFWTWLAAQPQGIASFVGTVTGSSFGFLALLAGALFNARLNRKRDDRLREESRKALASTLHAELTGIRRILLENAAQMRGNPPTDRDAAMIPTLTIKVFPEMLPQIGLLRPETVRIVIDAYIVVEQYLDPLIITYGAQLKADLPIDRQTVVLAAKYAKRAADYNDDIARQLKNAIDSLAPYMTVPRRALPLWRSAAGPQM